MPWIGLPETEEAYPGTQSRCRLFQQWRKTFPSSSTSPFPDILQRAFLFNAEIPTTLPIQQNKLIS